MKKPLVIFGDSAFAEIAYEYFTFDSEFKVVAFTVSRAYQTRESLFDLPVVPFEELTSRFPPEENWMFIALVYNELNRVRTRFYELGKAAGYRFATYVSSSAFVWRNVAVGENTFIFEGNVVQPFSVVGSNVILWSGNHIGHHSTIGNHCFFASHIVISGFCSIGESCFFGVNSTVANNVVIGGDCFIGAGALVTHDISAGSFLRERQSEQASVSTYDRFSIKTTET